MGVLFVSLLALLAVEYFFRLPLVAHARALSAIAHKAVRVVLSERISDHWKEVVLLRYAMDMALHTAAVALMLAGCAALVGLPALFLDWIFEPDPSTVQSLGSLPGLTGMTAVALLYGVVRKRLGAV